MTFQSTMLFRSEAARALWCVTLLVLGASLVLAQQPASTPPPKAAKQEPNIRVDVDLVQVPLSVLDPAGRIVTGLGMGNFRVYEDGVEQEVLKVQTEEVPISVGIVLDKSGSMGANNNILAARLMGNQFFKTAGIQDEFMVVVFDSRAQLITDFTQSVEKLRIDLMYMKPGGMTALNDAMYLALNKMKLGKRARKAVIVITDGEENHSRYNDKDVEQAAIEADSQVYVIGAGSGYWGGLLQRIASKTGGRMYEYSLYQDTAEHIWAELRNQYVVGYRSSNRARDGKWRKIRVVLKVPRGLPPMKVYAKSGYLARN
ncbi:MAG: VWA domain-containing protein [Acidobacteria bacterium]|nr:VWA domain-containing protein [Acidobacteriota bacterium]